MDQEKYGPLSMAPKNLTFQLAFFPKITIVTGDVTVVDIRQRQFLETLSLAQPLGTDASLIVVDYNCDQNNLAIEQGTVVAERFSGLQTTACTVVIWKQKSSVKGETLENVLNEAVFMSVRIRKIIKVLQPNNVMGVGAGAFLLTAGLQFHHELCQPKNLIYICPIEHPISDTTLHPRTILRSQIIAKVGELQVTLNEEGSCSSPPKTGKSVLSYSSPAAISIDKSNDDFVDSDDESFEDESDGHETGSAPELRALPYPVADNEVDLIYSVNEGCCFFCRKTLKRDCFRNEGTNQSNCWKLEYVCFEPVGSRPVDFIKDFVPICFACDLWVKCVRKKHPKFYFRELFRQNETPLRCLGLSDRKKRCTNPAQKSFLCEEHFTSIPVMRNNNGHV